MQGGHRVGEKNSLNFPGFSRAINFLFRRLSQQKINVIMTFIKGHSTSTPAILPSQQLFHKYLNDEVKILRLLQFFPDIAQNSPRIPSFRCSEKSLSIPDFPGLWPPCNVTSTTTTTTTMTTMTTTMTTCITRP